jgi:hypothetical protein
MGLMKNWVNHERHKRHEKFTEGNEGRSPKKRGTIISDFKI